jgi:hypothetical protein
MEEAAPSPYPPSLYPLWYLKLQMVIGAFKARSLCCPSMADHKQAPPVVEQPWQSSLSLCSLLIATFGPSFYSMSMHVNERA